MELSEIQFVVEDQFLDIAIEISKPSPEKLRLILRDKSFVDIRLSQNVKNRFDFHWERTHIDNTIYRYDNFPDTKFKKLETFPCHFHFQKENKVIVSPFSKNLPNAFVDFMEFVRQEMGKS
ncbi:MAG: DUF6516 family protein [Patescibacteria group bacterium]